MKSTSQPYSDSQLVSIWEAYHQLSERIIRSQVDNPREDLEAIYDRTTDKKLHALIQNDLAVLDAHAGYIEMAKKRLFNALQLDPLLETARDNLKELGFLEIPKQNGNEVPTSEAIPSSRVKVAILSLLFNWPSTGGGTVHTFETAKFLALRGYEVKHFYAQFLEWGIGVIREPLAAPSEAISFTPDQWNVLEIQRRFRLALKEFHPDWVIITDSWNSKPILAEASREYRFFLRIAAQECICPLNNVRLLLVDQEVRCCPRHQLATPNLCCQCVYQNGKNSGSLHQAEREMVAYGTNEYDRSLRWAIAEAEAVLVVNPLIGSMFSPYAKRVCVITSGFDPLRFPPLNSVSLRPLGEKIKILFAGLADELMKGFRVIHEACEKLWQKRQDFELVITSDPPDWSDPFTHFIGWQSQSSLPEVMSQMDCLVFPTVSEEALGRTAVEAMGAGLPVVASRIGGLQFTVVDGLTGLLFEPGNVTDLCQKLEQLLNDALLRERMGQAGRKRFEEHYTWDAIIERQYVPLLGDPIRVSNRHS